MDLGGVLKLVAGGSGGTVVGAVLHAAGPMAARVASENILAHMSADGRMEMAARFKQAAAAIEAGHWHDAVQPLADQIVAIKLPGIG